MDVTSHVTNENTISGLIKRLSNLYEKPSSSNKIHLLRRLFQLQMAEGVSTTEHVAEFNYIFNQLKAIAYPLDDELLTHCLLISMPDSWLTTVEVISGQKKVTLDFVRDRIINEGIRRNERGKTSGAALNVERGWESQRGVNQGRFNLRG
jgi:gag-polypeptide of LTR copia-type